MFSVLEVKREARASIKEAIGSVLLVSFVYVLIDQLLNWLGLKITYGSIDPYHVVEVLMSADNTAIEELMNELPTASGFGQLISTAMDIMVMMLAAGLTYFCLLISRRIKAGVGDLFDIFNIFLRVLGLLMLTAIYTMLWSLLFIIPGIIAAYRYSMAIYILLDRPDISVVDCIRLSCQMTEGSKGRLFLLDISFALWMLASAAASVLLAGTPVLAMLTGGIISIIYVPYYQVSLANVYNRLSNWQPETEAECSEKASEEPFDSSSWYDN